MAAIDPKPFTLRDGRSVVIRPATPEDAESYIDYLRDIARTSDYAVMREDEIKPASETAERFTKELAKADGIALVAVDANATSDVGVRGTDGVVVGDVSFSAKSPRRMRHHGHFGIGIRSTHRGSGLGRALLVTLLDWARAHPTIEKVCLGCFAENEPALRLYRSLGFREEGRRMAEFRDESGRHFDDVQMFLWVKPPPKGLDVEAWLARNGPRGEGSDGVTE